VVFVLMRPSKTKDYLRTSGKSSDLLQDLLRVGPRIFGELLFKAE